MEKEKNIEEKKEERQEVIEEKSEKCLGGCSGKCFGKFACMKPKVKGAIVLAIVIILGALAYYNRSIFVAATVDGFPIGRLSVMQEAEKQAGKTTLDNLILKKIVINEISRKGITVSKEEVAAEMTKIEGIVKAQSQTLEQALAAQGITRAELEDQIALQKKVEKLISPKPVVTEEEVTAYISANKISIPKGKEVEYLAETKSQMEQQKLQQAIQALVTSLKEKANVRYIVNY